MSFSFSTVQGWFETTEQDVVNLIANVKADISIAENDVVSALHWLAGQVPTIVAGLQTAASLASIAGVVSAPELAAANAAVAALGAFAQVQNAGTPTVATAAQSVIQGYVAYQSANAAVAQAKVVAAKAPKKA